MSEQTSFAARRLSLQDISQGHARALDGNEADKAVPSEVLEDVRGGFERGYAEGMQRARMEVEAAFLTTRTEWEKQAHAALEQAKAELQRSHVRLNVAADALAEALLEDRRWAESTAIELAYAALSRVLGDKAADHSLVVELCTQAQRECTGDVVSVRVAPADAEPLRRALPRLDVIADDGLLPGSCVLESPRGRFDAGLEGRLDQVRAALLAALYQEKPAA